MILNSLETFIIETTYEISLNGQFLNTKVKNWAIYLVVCDSLIIKLKALEPEKKVKEEEAEESEEIMFEEVESMGLALDQININSDEVSW